jgi:hypothetical protein
MIKVAIPIFLDRISPRLDCARRLLVLRIEDNCLVEKRELDISHLPPDEKIIQLKQMGIEQLICGGIRLEDRIGLNRFGIQVASPVFGEINTVIESFLKGALRAPGCSCPNRQRRRKRALD